MLLASSAPALTPALSSHLSPVLQLGSQKALPATLGADTEREEHLVRGMTE